MNTQRIARDTVSGARLLTLVKPLIQRLITLEVDPAVIFQTMLDKLEGVNDKATAEAVLISAQLRFADMSDVELDRLLFDYHTRNLPPLPDDQLDGIFAE
ncbi:MAG TPA: hypothetical protein VHL11_17390 [Phototrophicaceae bacterium]|jgi:hypothetical protein|nr:hypothetical protein [Phototrophicaceae bacterium]